MAAAKTLRRLKGENQLPKVIEGVTVKDGIEVIAADAKDAAVPLPAAPAGAGQSGSGWLVGPATWR